MTADQARHDLASSASRLAGRVCAAVGWAPDIFWSATPAEVAALFGDADPDPGPGCALGAGDLATLMEAYPDG